MIFLFYTSIHVLDFRDVMSVHDHILHGHLRNISNKLLLLYVIIKSYIAEKLNVATSNETKSVCDNIKTGSLDNAIPRL